MAEDATPKPEPKRGRSRKVIIAGAAVVSLVGAGAAAGMFVTGGLHAGPVEDPKRPKLVERNPEPEPVGEEADGKPVVKQGTISVKTDKDPIDPKRSASS